MSVNDSLSRLKSTLLISGIQTKAPALYQVIVTIIDTLMDVENELASSTGGGSSTTIITGENTFMLGMDGKPGKDGMFMIPEASSSSSSGVTDADVATKVLLGL